MSLPSTTYSFGASVRGPLHQQENRANEDAWLHSSGNYGTLIVVCDGMGSKTEARHGAKAACLAAKEAIIRWAKVPDASLSYLIHLVEVFWRLRIHPVVPGDAATTCLIVLACRDGSWVAGGVGDGILAIKTGEDVVTIIGGREEQFSNETIALGVSKGVQSWKIMKLPPTDEDRMAVLATDGVSDDLVSETLCDFCEWLVEQFQELTPLKRWHQLAAELRAWPTPKHLDDKTLAVLHTPSRLKKTSL